jgi:hypothetical protein
MTNPSRSASKVATLFRIVIPRRKARIEAKPATDIGVIALSAPPDHASASPRSIRRKLSPMACAPAEQAVAVAEFGPLHRGGSDVSRSKLTIAKR